MQHMKINSRKRGAFPISNGIKRIIKPLLLFLYKFGLRTFGGMGLQKIWPLGAIRDFLSAKVRTYDKPESVVFRGQTIFLDKNDNLELSVWGERHHASREIELMEHILKHGDTVVDVGANIGLMTVFMAQAVGERGRVFAFEPGPENVALLRKNIEANYHENVTITSAAVSDHSGTLTLFLSDFNVGDHRIYDPAEGMRSLPSSNSELYEKLATHDCRESFPVKAVSLDDFFKDKPRIAFIKIDVQGAEGAVLRGMLGILKTNPGIKILSEFWPAGLKMFGIEAGEYLKTFRGLGFDFYETDGKLSLVDRETLLQKYTPENSRSCDILIARGEYLK